MHLQVLTLEEDKRANRANENLSAVPVLEVELKKIKI
jgi:hypothetical protein